jgi:DNA-binding IclR family transcriptional regulator
MATRLRELRRRNRLRVIRALRSRLNLSQADISRLTGLSRTTVSTIVRDLIEQGVVEECNRLRSGRQGGRPGIGLRLKASGSGGRFRSFTDSIAVALRHLHGRVMPRIPARAVFKPNLASDT